MEESKHKFYIINCWSVQINNLLIVDGVLNPDRTLSFPDNPSWLPGNRLKAYRFCNWDNVNKLKMAPRDFYFENEKFARLFISEFYKNGILQMKKFYSKKENKQYQNDIKKVIKELEATSQKEHNFVEFKMTYFEYKAFKESEIAKHRPPAPIKE